MMKMFRRVWNDARDARDDERRKRHADERIAAVSRRQRNQRIEIRQLHKALALERAVNAHQVAQSQLLRVEIGQHRQTISHLTGTVKRLQTIVDTVDGALAP